MYYYIVVVVIYLLYSFYCLFCYKIKFLCFFIHVVLPFAIQSKFSEIVGKNGVPIVIAVGMQLDPSLWNEYIRNFNPPFSCLSGPVRLTFTNEEGQKLKTLNVKWTLNSPEVESEVLIKLEERKSFVFYRNGLFSGVRENCYEALNIVFHELNYRHYLLIVGDDTDIEKEIQQDIKIVASIAELKDNEFKNLCKSLEHSDYNFGNYYGKEAVFTLLIAPEADQLKEMLHKKLLCCGHTLTVIYSGHADSNGSWIFPDGSFSANDLKMVAQCAQGHVQHHIRIKIILNCCYGLIFAKQLGDIHAFLAGLTVYLNDDTECDYKTVEEFVFSKLIDCTEQSIKLNHLIIETIAKKMYDMTKHLITMREDKLNISILPYTVGPLVAQGILYDSLNMPYAKIKGIDIFKIRRRKPLLPRLPTAEGNNLTPADPQLIAFPAGNGDSTLFRWHDFNMLVDGGRYKDRPCFWETVRRLPDTQKLDVICVTHSDADHLFGVLRIFEEETLPIKVGELYTTVPLLPSSQGNIRPKGNRLWHRASHHKQNGNLTSINNLVTDPCTHIVNKKFPNGDTLEVFMLTPTKANLDKAAKLLPFIRISNLDEHNMASASLLICSTKNSEPSSQFALLTGDAPGEDIIKGLETVKEIAKIPYSDGRYSLDYVDMPHHGSKNNEPNLFLSKIKAKACLISTNGLIHDHPDDITLQELDNAMTKDYIATCLFTYSNERTYNKKGNLKNSRRDLKNSFAPGNKEKCTYADNRPKSEQRSKCLLVRLASNVCVRNNDNIFSEGDN